MKKILLLVFVVFTRVCFAQYISLAPSGSSVIFQDANYNIGINNATPAAGLDVTFSATSTLSSVIQADYTAGTGAPANYFNAQRAGAAAPDFTINNVGQVSIGLAANTVIPFIYTNVADLTIQNHLFNPTNNLGQISFAIMDDNNHPLVLAANVGSSDNSAGALLVTTNYNDAVDGRPNLAFGVLDMSETLPNLNFAVAGNGVVAIGAGSPLAECDINAVPWLTCIGSNPGPLPSMDYLFHVGNYNSIGGIDPISTNGDYFSIHDFGYVGIGQLNNGASLVEVSDIIGVGSDGIPLMLVDNGTPADPYFIVRGSSAGINVGIGVDAHASNSTLAVQGQGGTILNIFNGAGSGDGALVFGDASGGYYHEILNSSTTTLKIWPDIGALDVTAGTLEVYGNGLIDNNEHVVGNEQIDGNAAVNGAVIIGTGGAPEGQGSGTYPNWALAVDGQIVAKEMVTTTTDWPDTVFSDSYKLKPLKEVESYVNQNHHLPNVPCAAEVIKSGIDLGDMNKILLQKVEELTLYTISLEKRLRQLENK